MNKNTALSWANSLDITEQEFNRHLVELGYYMQMENGKRLQRTPKGVKHSTDFFGKIRWDINVVYDVVKLIGRKTGKYFYCEKCSAYNKVEDTGEVVQNCLCHNCSYPVKLGVKKHNEPTKKVDESWWSLIKLFMI